MHPHDIVRVVGMTMLFDRFIVMLTTKDIIVYSCRGQCIHLAVGIVFVVYHVHNGDPVEISQLAVSLS